MLLKKQLTPPLILLVIILIALASWSVMVYLHAEAFTSKAKLSNRSRALTVNQRAEYQRRIEEVYWRHRIWPKENTEPKPALDVIMSASAIQTKVEDYLRKSAALEVYWERPITAEQLQAEMDRMASQTRQPDMLRELWDATGNDPFVIAECLARPVLVERLIRNWYAFDETLHGKLKAQAETEIRGHGTPSPMRHMSGEYQEMELHKTEWGHQPAESLSPERAAQLSNRLSELREDEGHFFVTAIVEQGKDSIKIASVTWRKEPFETWWERMRDQVPLQSTVLGTEYSLQELTAQVNPCIDDTWNPTLVIPPARRRNHTAIWTGSEMIVWGGQIVTSNGLPIYFNTGGRYNPATDSWTLTSTSGAPTARANHTAIWTGSEMIVWGGSFGNGVLVDTGGRYDPSSDSWTPTTTISAPSPRSDYTAVWTGSQMIIWGGMQGSSRLNTGARYNPSSNTWSATTTTNVPIPRSGHTSVWTGSEMIVWGGSGDSSGGRYNPATNSWIATSVNNAPSARQDHTAVWTGNEMIVWGGGFNTGGRYNPTTNSWTPTSTANAPTARTLNTAVWTGNVMIVWGGGNNLNTGGRYNPSADTWTPTSTTNAPTERRYHTAVWTGSEMIIWGGSNISQYLSTFNTGGRYNPLTDSWAATSTSSSTPSERAGHTAVWTGAEMIVWGGYLLPSSVATQTVFNTGGRYDAATDNWTPSSIINAPAARTGHKAVWTGNEMIVWGGFDGTNYINTGGRYNPSTNTWTSTSLTNAPSARRDYTTVWTGSAMIVWGGFDSSSTNTGGLYNPVNDMWTNTNAADAPLPRSGHSAVWTGSEMIVWGGGNSIVGELSTGGRYNPQADSWTATNTSGAPTARSGHTAVWTGTEMIVWGWNSPGFLTNTGGRYNPATDSWTATSMNNAPQLSGHTAVWTGSEMIVWGGGYRPGPGEPIYFDQGGRYSPSSDSWMPVSTTNNPGMRGEHTAVWSGSQMIVWGGKTSGDVCCGGFQYYNTGGRYCAAGIVCTYSISPASQSFPQSGGTGVVNVTALAGCSWTSVSNAAWITITSGDSGTGNGAVGYSVSANIGSARTGSIVISGQVFLVMQDGIRGNKVIFDFDGDGKTDLSIWRPSEGFWYIINSSSGGGRIQGWGNSTDKLVPGDYDGDGKTDLAIWRPSTGEWWIINSSNGSLRVQQWGLSGDIPVPADYDGDGRTDPAVWRPSEGFWYIINSSTGGYGVQGWGNSTDKPVPGDYDGDGRTDLAVWRPSTGEWWIINSSNGSLRVQQWGLSGDIPVPADYDGDGRTDLAVWRPSEGFWYIINSSTGGGRVQGWGNSTDKPVAGDYDGDGKTDLAIWRPSTGQWWIINSSSGSARVQQWGLANDVPVPSAFVR